LRPRHPIMFMDIVHVCERRKRPAAECFREPERSDGRFAGPVQGSRTEDGADLTLAIEAL
ncbi:hypothetical protein KGQ19_37110, partial [Catenulispora sp. NL8]